MSGFQKAVKYIAMAFAGVLIIGIFSGIIRAVSLLGLIDKVSDRTSGEVLKEEAFTSDITKLEIDIRSADLVIQSGSELKVSADSEYFTFSESGGKLTVKEISRGWFNFDSVGSLTVTLPEEIIFEKVDIDAGAGRISIEALSAEDISLDLGAGDVDLVSLNISDSAEIVGGAGRIEISDSAINDLELDMGVGDLKLSAGLSGDSTIDFGVGKAEVELSGNAENYRLRIDKGIGRVTLSGNDMADGTYYGNGDNKLDMDGGIGDIAVSFTE